MINAIPTKIAGIQSLNFNGFLLDRLDVEMRSSSNRGVCSVCSVGRFCIKMGQNHSVKNYGFNQNEFNFLERIYQSYSDEKIIYTQLELPKAFQKPLLKLSLDQFLDIVSKVTKKSSFEKHTFFKGLDLPLVEFIKQLTGIAMPFLYPESTNGNHELIADYIIVNLEHMDFIQAMASCKHLEILWKLVFNNAFLGHHETLTNPNYASASRSWALLLRQELLFILDNQIDCKNRNWNLLYNSETDGKSWTIFKQRLILCEKSVIVVKDSAGCTFGIAF